MKPRLVLASASPRRAALLRDAEIVAEVRPTHVDETPPSGATPEEAALAIARRKADASDARDAWVLAADTLLDFDGHILGKPRDAAHARAMLRMLSGRAHDVITGVAVRAPDGSLHVGASRTRVTFRALSDAQINAYVATGEPLDKAGAYGVQSTDFVAALDGPRDNVIGLPVGLALALLEGAGYPG